MPAALRFDAYRVVIDPNDHRPAHVHVVGKSSEAVFILNAPGGSPVIRDNFGCSRKEAAEIAAVLGTHLVLERGLGGDP